MVSMHLDNCMKFTVILAIVLASINVIVYSIAFIDFGIAYYSYDADADDIIGVLFNDTSSNFNETSEWFAVISEEYESLSSFDKEYVYCDVVAIQSDPSAMLVGAKVEMGGALVLTILSIAGLLYASVIFCCVKRSKFYGVDMADIGSSNPRAEDPADRAFAHAVRVTHPGNQSKKKKTREEAKFEKDSEMLSEYRYNMFIMFLTAGPFIALFWLLVVRRSQVDGLDCQAMFYACGLSGECSMDDLMTTVALNSSLIQMLASYPFVIVGPFASVLSLCFVLGTGIFLSVGTKNWSYATFPAIMFVYGGVPSAWVYFIDPYMPFEPALAVMVLAVLPMIFQLFYTCYNCYRCCKDSCY